MTPSAIVTLSSKMLSLFVGLQPVNLGWLGGILLNSFALVIPSGWSSWLATPTLVGGLGLSLW